MVDRSRLKCFDKPDWWGRGTARIVYAMFEDGRCVFTGLGPKGLGTSSINAAEEIIGIIAKFESVDPLQIRFFDLQTNLMYGHVRTYGQAGEFEFDELELEFIPKQKVPPNVILIGNEDRIHVKAWHRVECPTDVVELFAEFIGPNPYQMKHANDHRPGSPAHRRQTFADRARKAPEN